MRWLVCTSLLLLGCAEPNPGADSGLDGGADASADGGADGGADAAAEPDASALEDAGPPPAECPIFGDARTLGAVSSTELRELSGLAASRVHAGLLYANNDSGDSARVFILRDDGTVLGDIALSGATRQDYEDIAVGPGPDGESWVYVGDHGDNAARTGAGTPRASVWIHRFPEAIVDPALAAIDATPESFELTYPGAPHDCESLAVDPDTGDLYMLTKEDAGPSTLFVLRAPLASGVLEPVTTIEIGGPLAPGSRSATAMDISPGGRALLVRTYSSAHLFTRGDTETWADALGRAARPVPVQAELQAEAIAWRPDGRGYITSSEGLMPPLHSFDNDARCPTF